MLSTISRTTSNPPARRKRAKRFAISICDASAADPPEQTLDFRTFDSVRAHQCAGPRIRKYFAKRRLVFSPNRHLHYSTRVAASATSTKRTLGLMQGEPPGVGDNPAAPALGARLL
jgi:hypothetical protein